MEDVILINGKKPGPVVAEAWRKLSGFDPFAGDKFDLDGTLERIALVYGLPVDEVAAGLQISDIIPCYLGCVRHVNGLVFSKLSEVSKKKQN